MSEPKQVKSTDDMVDVDGVRVRPEDVAQVRKQHAAVEKAEAAANTAQEEVGMVVVNGVQYRPEDAPRKGATDREGTKPETVSTKTAQPRNKARSASSKG